MAKAGTASGAGELVSEVFGWLTTPPRESGTREPVEVLGQIPRWSYGQFLNYFTWKQGEHITEIGPTGYGKTTLAVDLLNRRKYVMAFGTKKEDDTLDKLLRRGYKRVNSFKQIEMGDNKVVIWPRIDQLGSSDEIMALQREVFREALFDGAFRQGGWTVYLDELRYITDRLNLKSEVELLWEQGRSEKVSLAVGYQRPRNIPLLAYDQATHLVFFKETDYENLSRMAETVTWLDRKLLISTIANLAKYDFLYLNKDEHKAVISRVEL